MLPKTLGELKEDSRFPHRARTVKEEIRANLLRKLEAGAPLFPGIVGYEETALPGIINALLARQDFILLGLRGQAKSRILRQLTEFLDEYLPYIEGSEIHDDPFHPISDIGRQRLEKEGDQLPIAFLHRDQRYVEKLATPDVTIADIIGDLDPIKAAKSGKALSSFENIHFGLLPRAHRCIFTINELPDLAPKIQVGLFNILQEGDVQIKGFPLRLPLDLLMAFTANPDDYTARGKIITPLKDRIGAEVRTHYPKRLQDGIRITRQEAWLQREDSDVVIPEWVEEVVELVAFHGRRDKRVDHRSGVSQRLPIACLEFAASNAERRALVHGEGKAVLRVGDVYASMPAITGKLELEYEGEMKGAERIGRELIHRAVLDVFKKHFGDDDFEQIVQWFDLGGSVRISDQTGAREFYQAVNGIQGLEEPLKGLRLDPDDDLPLAVSGIEFVLEGLTSLKRISRNAEQGYYREQGEEEARDLLEQMKSRRGSRSFN
ncbi:MAG TPA: magnesium chelatase [Acidobacteriota bacterium]|nr:magnesium chelatase [Acidobacteriota bacterium]